MNEILCRIKDVINSNGLSDTAFAKKCNIPQTTFANMFVRDSDPKADVLKKIIEEYSVSASWLLTGEGDMFALPQRLDEKLVPCLEGIWGCPEDRLVPLPGSSGLELQALRVTGDSMQPTLKEGDVAICQPSGWLGDGLYILRNMEFFSVKRVVLAPDGYRIVSDNAIYPAYNCPAESLGLVGKVAFALVKM